MRTAWNGDRVILTAELGAQDEAIFDRLEAGVSVQRINQGGYVRLIIAPGLPKPKATNRYDGQTVDELVTLATTKGIPIQKNALRADVINVLEVAETDIEAAKEMAVKVRSAAVIQHRPASYRTGQTASGASSSSKSENVVQ